MRKINTSARRVLVVARRCRLQFGLVVVGVSLIGGCSSSRTAQFDTKWKTATVQYERQQLEQPAQAETPAAGEPRRELDIEGPWIGRWRSTKQSHSGALRCVVTRTAPDFYTAQFHATYLWFFRFAYSMPLHVDRRNEAYNVVHFKGETELGGMAGGRYQYRGYAGESEFICTFQSPWDYGYFQMTRPDFSGVGLAEAK